MTLEEIDFMSQMLHRDEQAIIAQINQLQGALAYVRQKLDTLNKVDDEDTSDEEKEK